MRGNRHDTGAENRREIPAQARELLGSGGRDDGQGGANPAPGNRPFGKAAFGTDQVDKPRIRWQRRKIGRACAPLFAKRLGQVVFADPAMGQQDLTQPNILARAKRQRLEHVTRIDRPAIQKDTAKRTATRRGGRTAGHDLAQPGSLRRDGPDCGLRHDLSGADRAMLRAPG